jgi:pimeloyl-ACP methyl ester carboxylesterase
MKTPFIILFAFLLLPYCHTQDLNSNKPTDVSHPINSLEKVRIGDTDQWLLSRGENTEKPVLLVVHGGPGAASIGLAHEFYTQLEKHFIVVNWDQRGAGKSFTFFLGDVTPETFISDTVEVIDYLRMKFNTQKIYIMGHSWGGYIATIVAHRYPERLHAIIAVGLMVNAKESLNLSYQFIKSQSYQDASIAKKASEMTFEEYFQDRRYWLNLNRVGMFHGDHSQDESSYLTEIMLDSEEYNLYNIITYLPGIWKTSAKIRPYFLEMNLNQYAPNLKIPIHLFVGRFDYYTHHLIASKYLSEINSPEKSITIFEDLAHAPHFEDPSKFADELLKKLQLKK